MKGQVDHLISGTKGGSCPRNRSPRPGLAPRSPRAPRRCPAPGTVRRTTRSPRPSPLAARPTATAPTAARPTGGRSGLWLAPISTHSIPGRARGRSCRASRSFAPHQKRREGAAHRSQSLARGRRDDARRPRGLEVRALAHGGRFDERACVQARTGESADDVELVAVDQLASGSAGARSQDRGQLLPGVGGGRV